MKWKSTVLVLLWVLAVSQSCFIFTTLERYTVSDLWQLEVTISMSFASGEIQWRSGLELFSGGKLILLNYMKNVVADLQLLFCSWSPQDLYCSPLLMHPSILISFTFIILLLFMIFKILKSTRGSKISPCMEITCIACLRNY